MTGLVPHDGDGSYAVCVHCGELAVGPCARCEAPLCGDCCVIMDGTTKPYAICRDCDAGGGSVRSGWVAVIVWVLVPIVGLAVALMVLGLVFGP